MAANPDSRAYVTLLSSDGFAAGALALNESLRRCKAAVPLYVLVGSNVSDDVRELLVRSGMKTIAAEPLDIPEDVLLANLRSDHHRHWLAVFEKLLVFSLTRFERVVYLDCDMVVIKNIDHLFASPHMSAVIADISPGGERSNDLNAGLMVITPEPQLADELLATIPDVFESEKRWRTAAGRPVSIGVQSVINAFWSDWLTAGELHLDGRYNVLVHHLDYYVRSLGYRWRGPEGIHVLHFIGERKPWMTSPYGFARRVGRLVLRRRMSEALAEIIFAAILQRARLRLLMRRYAG